MIGRDDGIERTAHGAHEHGICRVRTRDASLAGRVVVKLSIGGMGNVTTSFIESSTLKVPQTDKCIADAVRRWEFPKPNGGLVIVSYPFVLKSVNNE